MKPNTRIYHCEAKELTSGDIATTVAMWIFFGFVGGVLAKLLLP